MEKLSGVCERLHGERTYVIHRAAALDTVKAAVPGEWLRLGARCTSVAVGPDSALLRFPAGAYTDESWSAKATNEEFHAEFADWNPRVTDLIAADGVPGRWALLDRAPLRHWSRGRITLPGGAVHPMFPFFAQGAAQSIEDAAVLAHCLATSLDNPEQALKRYESARIERTTRLQQVSHARRDINHLPDGPEQQARDSALAAAGPLVSNGWIYGHDAEEAFTS